MSAQNLPRSKGLGETLPRCPWCDGWMDGAKVDAQELLYALSAFGSQAFLCGVPIECPECGKPSELTVRANSAAHEQTSSLQGTRTKADRRYLGEPERTP